MKYGKKVSAPKNIEKEGYIFIDWYTTKDFTKKFDFNTPIKKNYILYAKWNENHQYDEGVITTPANCTNDGVKTFACKKCGNKITESIPANGHNYDGITCTSCGNKLIDNLAELNHEYTDEDGLLVTLHSFVHEEINGYNDYSIKYSIRNNIYGSELLAGHFYIIYQLPDGSFESEFQTGFFNYLYYGDKDSRYYKWRLTSEKTFICLEYISNSKHLGFDSIPNNELLNWIIE